MATARKSAKHDPHLKATENHSITLPRDRIPLDASRCPCYRHVMADGKKSKPGAGRKGSHPTPHDTLFRAVFSDPAHARALVRDHLPNDIAALLADKPPVILDRSFIDEDMRETRADLLLEVELAAGGTGFVHVLVEHKSRFDPEVVLQMAGYMISVRKDHVRRGKGRDGRAARARNLPPIIPLLGHSGARPWTGPTDLEGMMATDNPTLHFLRGPHLILRQWARMPPGALSRDPVPQAGLLALTGRGPAWLDEMEAALQDNPVLQDQFAVHVRDAAMCVTALSQRRENRHPCCRQHQACRVSQPAHFPHPATAG